MPTGSGVRGRLARDRSVLIRLGNQMKRLRRGVFQKDVAYHLGVTQAMVSYWERGECEPPLGMLIRIADHFGVTLDELVGRKVNR
jgi:transcriptional regulator with XRE-family HTH domain